MSSFSSRSSIVFNYVWLYNIFFTLVNSFFIYIDYWEGKLRTFVVLRIDLLARFLFLDPLRTELISSWKSWRLSGPMSELSSVFILALTPLLPKLVIPWASEYLLTSNDLFPIFLNRSRFD